jgi:hypothetical protein
MNEYQIKVEELITEGDVELKVITPLLLTPEPIGLGFENSNIQSKISLRKLQIDKGSKSQLYYPDFLINVNGIPLIIIEAKKPDEDLKEAFRQASLYAGEINRFFKKNVNPCELIIASDGKQLYAGTWDSGEPAFIIPVEEWLTTNDSFGSFLSFFSYSSIKNKAGDARKKIRTEASFKNPLSLLGGKYIQNQSINNTFGETISIRYQHLFNPNEESERKDIVRNAYVRVTKHQSHVEPIDRLIRKKIRPAIEESNEILDNEKPNELISKFKNAHDYNNQVILLIGSVGSGKSTFSTYLKEVALDKAVLSKTCWARLNLNDAPVSASEIYTWVKKSIIQQLKEQHEEIDFDELASIEKIYQEEIKTLKKGVLSLLDPEDQKYKTTLVERILTFQDDLDLTLKCFIREFVHKHGQDLIIVLDNCDKRNLEEQLLMFEVANWIKDSIKAIVFLPLRDTTFDHFRNQKPLDTVIKDLIFRINPPSLEKVIYQRIKYANRLAEKSENNYYYLPNGWRVKYPSEDELHYLKSILTSLFQNNFFKRLISGLAGRDIRKGIEVFLDFCKSGHISEHEILKIKRSKGEHKLPNHIIGRVFLRGNRLYYSDEESRIKNLFHSNPSDDLPDPFIRVAILKWLYDQRRKKGPSGIIGFHKTRILQETLLRFGHSTERVSAQLLFLLKNSLIISESQDEENLNPDELISINPPGVIHYELLRNIDYLSACSENVWYKAVEVAESISKDMSGQGEFTHLSIQNNSKHSELLVEYLEAYYKNHFEFHNSYLSEEEDSAPCDFHQLNSDIESFNQKLVLNPNIELPSGSVHNGKVVNIKNYGIICEIENCDQVGLIHISNLTEDFDEIYSIGDDIQVEIILYKRKHNKYNLKIAE